MTGPRADAPIARARGWKLRSQTIGALPILNAFLRRMRLKDFLRAVNGNLTDDQTHCDT